MGSLAAKPMLFPPTPKTDSCFSREVLFVSKRWLHCLQTYSKTGMLPRDHVEPATEL